MSPPVLQPPKDDLSLLFYPTTTKMPMSMMLAQENERKEHVIYYLNRKFLD